jgi:hypothetical protein
MFFSEKKLISAYVPYPLSQTASAEQKITLSADFSLDIIIHRHYYALSEGRQKSDYQ